AAKAAASEAAQAKDAAARSSAADKALPEVQARAEALAKDLEAAQRKIETLTALASARNGESVRSQQKESDRADRLERDLADLRRDFQAKADALGKSASEALRAQQLAERVAAELRQQLQEYRQKAEKLAGEVAAARHDLETQVNFARTGERTHNQQLSTMRQTLDQAETATKAAMEALAQERRRNTDLAHKLEARTDPALGSGRVATAGSNEPGGLAGTHGGATPVPASMPDKPPLVAGTAQVMYVPGLTVPEVSGNPEVVRLTARASSLLREGNIAVARVVLERAAEMGSASALFSLAETYDPAMLSAWRTFGTQGDAAKAQQLYAKAFAGGVREAKDRLNKSSQ
ncbi:MAG: hypothetical protein JOY64_19935, partial [Alphaproteobacteria bacterium]|nr:hypothetical protein [Alphaproteobacteria bacterium]